MDETLDHEKFEGIKELAEISTKISAGTAALAALQKGEETYLSEREQKLVARLKQTLADSADLIKDIGANHDALVGYRMDLTGFHDSILSLIQCVDACLVLINEASAELETRVENHAKAVTTFKEACQRERVQIDGERGELAQWRDQLGAQERSLNDREKTLKSTLERLKLN